MLLDCGDLSSTLPLDRGYSGTTGLLDALQRICLSGYDFLGARINRIRSTLSLLSIVLSGVLRTIDSTVRFNSPVLSQGGIRTSGISVLLSSISSILCRGLSSLSRSNISGSSLYGINDSLNLSRFDKIPYSFNGLNVICNRLNYTASNSSRRGATSTIKITVILTVRNIRTASNIIRNGIDASYVVCGSINVLNIICNDLNLISYGDNISRRSLDLFLDNLGSVRISLSLIGIVLGRIVLAID